MTHNFMLNMMLNQLKTNNPNAYSQITQLMNSGRNPNDILNELVRNGKVSQDQIKQAENFLNGKDDKN